MSASLAIVAQAPLVATSGQSGLSTNGKLEAYLQREGDVGSLHFLPWLASRLRRLQSRLHGLVLVGVRVAPCYFSPRSPPAPTMTLDMPRHREPSPSTLDIVYIAFEIPV